MKAKKGTKRLQVIVSDAEADYIERSAAALDLSVSRFLRLTALASEGISVAFLRSAPLDVREAVAALAAKCNVGLEMLTAQERDQLGERLKTPESMMLSFVSLIPKLVDGTLVICEKKVAIDQMVSYIQALSEAELAAMRSSKNPVLQLKGLEHSPGKAAWPAAR